MSRLCLPLTAALALACGVEPQTTEELTELLSECDPSTQTCASDELLPELSGPPRRPRMWYTCGDPVCRGYTIGGTYPLCGSVQEGQRCPQWAVGLMCDPQDSCNRRLECRTNRSPGPCPISRAAWKHDIDYLDPGSRSVLASQILDFRLASWRYNWEDDTQPTHLGFIIDDVEGTPAVAADGDHVDLYGYTTMAVAAIQEQQDRLDDQARQIEALRVELAALRAELKGR